jgi:hypothetical protein
MGLMREPGGSPTSKEVSFSHWCDFSLVTENRLKNLLMCQQYPKKTPLPNAYETK